MYVELLLIPLSLSIASTFTLMLLLVDVPKLTFTVGAVVSCIVVCWISLSFTPSVNFVYTVSPGLKPVILCPLVIVIHSPSSVPFIWYCNVYSVSVVEIGIFAVPSPCHTACPNTMVLSGISTAPVPSCTVIIFSIVVPSSNAIVTFMS